MTKENLPEEKKQFKAFIRVVKSLTEDHFYGVGNVIREPLIEAKDKTEVKQILLEKYPQFFPTGKVYERESKKDKAQFFYVVIYPLYNYEKQEVEEGEWKCAYCGQVYENKYISRPRVDSRLLGEDIMFCRSDDDTCYRKYVYSTSNNGEIPDDLHYITKDSPNYIYKITEKSTGRCYIGKTKNAPFFRWWNHLTHSNSPFGLYLKKSNLSNWTFEVLQELPACLDNSDVLRIESEYIVKFDSINNGFNTTISNKSVTKENKDELKLNFGD